jgi:exosortase/archaeosortase family protein
VTDEQRRSWEKDPHAFLWSSGASKLQKSSMPSKGDELEARDTRTQPASAGKWLVGALFPLIWLLDRRWLHEAPDVALVTLVLPLILLLARRHPGPPPHPTSRFFAMAAGLLSLGIVLQQMTLMAFGWAALATRFLLPPHGLPPGRIILVLAGAFPWVLLDASFVGWWFRLTSAAMAGTFYDLLGFPVTVHGTIVKVDDLPVSIEAACNGLQLLQVLFSGGVALSLILFHRRHGFWWMVASLPILAWLANTLRIVVVTGWGLRFGSESAQGAFHTWGALGVILAMFLMILPLSQAIAKWCRP